jgi:hypothetical protein
MPPQTSSRVAKAIGQDHSQEVDGTFDAPEGVRVPCAFLKVLRATKACNNPLPVAIRKK